MTTLPPDPLTGTDRLLIDGTNLLHAMSRKPGAAPQAALIGRLRAVVPPSIGIELVFDGAPERGHARRADRVRADRPARGPAERRRGVAVAGGRDAGDGGCRAAGALLVVSDDHALRASLRAKGARTAGSAWLLGRLERPKLVGAVGREPPARATAARSRPARATEAAPTREGTWKPGRGATTKKGNPRRGRPSSGRMPP